MTTDLPGFADPVADAQACFRAVLQAMAHPGRIVAVDGSVCPPVPLAPATAAVMLTLVDAETPVWLAPDVQAAEDWVRFHCGAPSAGPGDAAFAVCLELSALEAFHWGSFEGPETSTTIILQRPDLDAGPLLRIGGPGLREPTNVRLGLPDGFADAWQSNHAAFPRGVDIIVCSGRRIAALPRSLHVERV